MNKAPEAGKAGEWLTFRRFAALLGGLIVICFAPVLLGLEAFAYGDSGLFAYPVAFHHRESLWRGEIPLWNPLNGCGIPFLAQWNTLTLYPLSACYLLLPMPWSFGLFCLGHLFIAGLGMHVLAYRWTGSRLAASLAGTVFAFNGLTWYGLMWPHIIAAMAWMPWVIWAIERACCGGRRELLVASLLTAMQLLSGGAEVILQTWLVIAILWIAQALRKEFPLRAGAVRLAGIGLIGFALAAVQLLPFLDLLAHSQRGSGFTTGEMGTIAAMPLTGWLNYFVPLFGCSRNSTGVFVQAGQTWTASYYLGIGAVSLAIVTLFRSRGHRVWILWGLTLFGLLLALGPRGVVYDWFKRLLPLLGLIRFPVKFTVLVTFAIPLLASFSFSRLLALPTERWIAEWRAVGKILLGIVVMLGAIVFFAWKFPPPAGTALTVAANAVTRAIFLAAMVGCFVLLRRPWQGKIKPLLEILVILLLWFDVFTHSSNLSPTAPSAALRPNIIREFFKWDQEMKPGISRAMQSKTALWAMLSPGTTNLETEVASGRLSLFMNLNLLDDISKFDGFYSMDLKESLDIFKHVYFSTNEAAHLKDFLGISHINSPTNVLEWVKRDSALPLLTIGQKPIFAGPEETLRDVLSAEFDPLKVIYLPVEAREAVGAEATPNARLVSWQMSSRGLRAEVQTEARTMLAIAQTSYHPWQAYVDGKPVPLWRANYGFQAIEVPAGAHRVSLVYLDRAFWVGAGISLFSLLSVVTAMRLKTLKR